MGQERQTSANGIMAMPAGILPDLLSCSREMKRDASSGREVSQNARLHFRYDFHPLSFSKNSSSTNTLDSLCHRTRKIISKNEMGLVFQVPIFPFLFFLFKRPDDDQFQVSKVNQ